MKVGLLIPIMSRSSSSWLAALDSAVEVSMLLFGSSASASASDKYTTEEIVVLLLPCTIPKAAC